MVSYTFDMLLDSQLNSVNGAGQFCPASSTSPITGGSFAHLRAQWQPAAPAIRMDKGFGMGGNGLGSQGIVGAVVETGTAGTATALLNGIRTFNKFDSGNNSRFIELYASPPDSRWRDWGGTTRG